MTRPTLVQEEGNDQEELAAELADLNDREPIQQDEEDAVRQQTFDAEEDDDEDVAARKDNHSNAKKYVEQIESYSTNNLYLFSNIAYDIDLYLEKKAERRRGNRRRGAKNGDVDLAGPDGDQFVAKLIDQMKIATEEDRIFNKSRQPATAKLLLLPLVQQHLCRADLSEMFLDNGILAVFKVRTR